MADFHQQDLADSRFEQVHLQRAKFHQVHLNDADFNDVDLTGAQFREVFFKDVVMRGAGFVNSRIEGEIDGLTVNGVDVAPLVQAELERREPDLAKMRPTDPDGFREAWDMLERLWAETVERARGCRRPRCTSRSTASGRSSRRCGTSRSRPSAGCAARSSATRRRGAPVPAVGPDARHPGVPRDRAARPSLDEALALRLDRQATVRQVVDGARRRDAGRRHRRRRSAGLAGVRAATRCASACSRCSTRSGGTGSTRCATSRCSRSGTPEA